MGISTLGNGTKKNKLLGLVLLFLSTASNAAITDSCESFTWSTPGVRENGTAIQKIERFDLYHKFEDVLLPIIEIDANDTEYSACNLQTGIHIFYLKTIESYGDLEVESKESNTYSVFIQDEVIPDPSPPEEPVIIVTIRISVKKILPTPE
ncbi:MAG: hypothetical protein JKX72_02565 [Robiginitomaculum sp.]|nr:hypothetical protein [Robiginitomaculum sp.]